MKIHSQSPVSAAKPVSAVPAPIKKNDPREVAFGTGVPTGKPDDAPATGGHARLDAFAQKIEKRFENALASKDLTPRQQQALEKERDRFHSMIARFEAAYMDGADSAKMDKAEGLQKLMASFTKSVNHILAGGADVVENAPKVPYPTAADLGTGRTRGGIDTVG